MSGSHNGGEVKAPLIEKGTSPTPAYYECPHCGKDVTNDFGAISAHVMCCEGLYREAK